MPMFAVMRPDQHLTVKPPAMHAREWVTTFWASPREHPDFAYAWLSRFLITLATFTFTTCRLFFVRDEIGLTEDDAPAAVTIGALVYTVGLIASGWIAGRISDRALLLAVSSPDDQNHDLLLYSAGVAALVGALPIKKVK